MVYELALLPEEIGSRRVVVDFDSRKYARVPHALTNEASIEASWVQAKARNARIFNGSKFRLAGPIHVGETVSIPLGLTDYRDYLGTNCRAAAFEALVADGRRDFGYAGAHLSNALGCETVFVTADAKLVLLRRSTAVATHAGQYNGPSGHAEPSRSGADPGAVASEVLEESIVAEIVEELGVPRTCLAKPKLIGCMLETASLKPDLLFATTATLTSVEITAAYEKALEKWESDDILFLSLEDILQTDVPLKPVTHAALDCYRRSLLGMSS